MNRWKSWGASVTGPGHLSGRVPNQDAWAANHFQWGDVLVVSDGLGSCPHAEKGAHAACEAVRQAAEFSFQRGRQEASEFPQLIQDYWRLLISPLSPEECSATCLFVVREEGGAVLCGMLGDGLLAGMRTDGSIDLLVADKDDSFANFTCSLSSPRAPLEWKIRRSSENVYHGFLLCTDGISDDLLPESIEPFVEALMTHYCRLPPEELDVDLKTTLEAWPVPGHSDDKTVACLYQAEDSDD